MQQQLLNLPQRKRRLRRGDTLIEVIISFAILASVITMATAGALNAWRTQRMAAERTQATGLAQRQADALKAYRKSVGWAGFISGVGSGTNSMVINGSSWAIQSGTFVDTDQNYSQFTQSIIKNPSSAVCNSSTCEFTISVTWQSAVRPTGSPADEVKLLVTLSDNN